MTVKSTIVCHVSKCHEMPRYAHVPGDFSELDGMSLTWSHQITSQAEEHLDRLGDLLYTDDGQERLKYTTFSELWAEIRDLLKRQCLTLDEIACITVEGDER